MKKNLRTKNACENAFTMVYNYPNVLIRKVKRNLVNLWPQGCSANYLSEASPEKTSGFGPMILNYM